MMMLAKQRQLTVRALLALMRKSLSLPLHACDLDAISRASPDRLVAAASAHSVVNLIARAAASPDVADCIDPDVAAFLTEMRRRNAERNVALADMTAEASHALAQAGIVSVALKGCSEFVAPIYDAPEDRLLGDIDILVPAGDIDGAIAALKAIGYSDRGAPYYRGSIHAPALWHERWPTAIELHTELSWGVGRTILPAADIIARSAPSAAMPLRAPSLADRLCHLVVHAQINSGRQEARWLLIRDLANYQRLSLRATAETWEAVASRFAAAGAVHLLESFQLAAAIALAATDGPALPSAASKAWARKTLHLLAWPEAHRWMLVSHYTIYYLRRFLTDSGLRRKYLRDVLSPSTVHSFIARHLLAYRSFQ